MPARICTPLTEQAMKIASLARHGRQDKTGIPYIYHPIHPAGLRRNSELIRLGCVDDHAPARVAKYKAALQLLLS